MRLFFAAFASLFVALSGVPALAQNADTHDETKGSAFTKPVSCVDTTIGSITDRFGKPVGAPPSSPAAGTTGMNVTFANKVTLVAYSVSEVVYRERVGDRVQLCFLGHIEGTQDCKPATDLRGWFYRVFDYRLNAAWTAMNSQHACGGA